MCFHSNQQVLFDQAWVLLTHLPTRYHCDVTFFSDIIRHSRHSCDVIRHPRHSCDVIVTCAWANVTSHIPRIPLGMYKWGWILVLPLLTYITFCSYIILSSSYITLTTHIWYYVKHICYFLLWNDPFCTSEIRLSSCVMRLRWLYDGLSVT